MVGAGRIERYVLGRTLASLLGALAVITAVIVLVDFADVSRNVGSRTDASVSQILGLTLLQSPATILSLSPFVFLFGTLSAFVALNRRNELIAMRAAGVSAWRFIFPAAFAAFLVGVLVVTTLEPVAAQLNAAFETQRDRLMEDYLKSAPEAVWLRQGDERSQVVIRAQARDRVDGAVRLRGVSMFVYALNPQGAWEFSRRIEANEARLTANFWQLTGVREATPGAGAVQSDSLSIPSTLDERSAIERFASASTIPFWRLPAVISRTERSGFSAVAYRLRLQQLFATPLLFSAMSILAAAFSLRLIRLGGLAAFAGAGVTLGFVFFFFDQLCNALGRAEVIGVSLAAWAPPLIALLFGFTLLCYTEDG